MNNVLSIIGMGCMGGIVLALMILGTISYKEKRMIEQYRAETEMRFNSKMEKLDRILEELQRAADDANKTDR